MAEPLTLAEAATELGITAGTLRWQIRNGKLRARKIGPVWTVARREVDRYRAEQLGNHDPRPAKARRAAVGS